MAARITILPSRLLINTMGPTMLAAIKRASQSSHGFGNFSIVLKKSIIAFIGLRDKNIL
jgi:hypothetical protein